jgi:hypothetical protein
MSSFDMLSRKNNWGTDISNGTAVLGSPAQKIQKILISFLGLYGFLPDYSVASGKDFKIS